MLMNQTVPSSIKDVETMKALGKRARKHAVSSEPCSTLFSLLYDRLLVPEDVFPLDIFPC